MNLFVGEARGEPTGERVKLRRLPFFPLSSFLFPLLLSLSLPLAANHSIAGSCK